MSKYHTVNKLTGGDSVITLCKNNGKMQMHKESQCKVKDNDGLSAAHRYTAQRQIVPDGSEKPTNGWKARARLL